MDTLLSCPGQNRLNQHWMGSNFCDLEPLFKMLASISSGQRTECRARITWTRVQVCLAMKGKQIGQGWPILKIGLVMSTHWTIQWQRWNERMFWSVLRDSVGFPLNQAGIFLLHLSNDREERLRTEDRRLPQRHWATWAGFWLRFFKFRFRFRFWFSDGTQDKSGKVSVLGDSFGIWKLRHKWSITLLSDYYNCIINGY